MTPALIVITGLVALVILLFIIGCRNAFKVGYYETTLENNRHLFTAERYANIERVKQDFWMFLK